MRKTWHTGGLQYAMSQKYVQKLFLVGTLNFQQCWYFLQQKWHKMLKLCGVQHHLMHLIRVNALQM